jgi:hypothetical protein
VKVDDPIGNTLGENDIGVFFKSGDVRGGYDIDHVDIAG